jgi:hypothetical protein
MSAPANRSFLARVRRGQAATAQDGPTHERPHSTGLVATQTSDLRTPVRGRPVHVRAAATRLPRETAQPGSVLSAEPPASGRGYTDRSADGEGGAPKESLLRPLLVQLGKDVRNALRDLLPIIFVIAFFQGVILRQPLPNLPEIVTGAVMVVLGLALFIRGLEMGLFPLGEAMAHGFARKASILWLVAFAFALGFGTTVAEPALIAIAGEAAQVAADAGTIAASQDAISSYALGLRITVALSVGSAVVIGVIRIVKGWPVQWFIIGGYAGVMIMTLFAPGEIIGIAYDSGGVTTSTVTVPLVTALGVGLATSIRGRNPMVDGFGLIALASLTPMIFVMGYGVVM